MRLFYQSPKVSVLRMSPAVASQDPGVRYVPLRRAIGVDISDHAIKAVELSRKGKGYEVRAFSHILLPEGTILRGEIRQPDALKTALKELLRTSYPAPFQTRYVLFSVPQERVFLHPFTFPSALTEQQIRQAVPFEAEGQLPIVLSDVSYDIHLYPSVDSSRRVLFAAAAKDILTSYIDVFTSVGLLPVCADIESLSLIRAFLPPDAPPSLIVDIGNASSTITVVEQQAVCSTLNIPFGGSTITAMLSDILNISPANAEQVKNTQGFLVEHADSRTVLYGSIAPLTEEIQRTAVYHATQIGHTIQQILLTGGTSRLAGLAPFLQDRLKLPVILADPTTLHTFSPSATWTEEGRKAFFEHQAMYAGAVGLALRGASSDIMKNGMNILPLSIRQRYEQWRDQITFALSTSFLAAGVLVALAILLVFVTQLLVQRNTITNEAHIIQQTFHEPRYTNALTEGVKVNTEVHALQTFLGIAGTEGQLFARVRDAVPDTFTLSKLESTASDDPRAQTTMIVNGIAPTRDAFLAFEKTLRTLPDVERVDSPVSNLNAAENVSFTITVVFHDNQEIPPSPSI